MKKLLIFCLFFSPISFGQMGIQENNLKKIDLNSLRLDQIESYDFTNKDFSATREPLKNELKSIFRGKNLTGSKFGFDLENSGIELAKKLTRTDFTGAKNAPAGLAQGKDLSGAKLHGLDLTHIKAEKAKFLDGVDFTGAENAPAGMVEGKYLKASKLHGLDLAHIKIQMATNLEGVDFTGAQNPPAGMAEGKDLYGAKLHGLDLTHIKIEQAENLKAVDFTGAKNAPEGMAEWKSLEGAKLHGLDLAHIKIQNANNLSEVDFTGAKNPPEGMAEGKELYGAKLHGLDLTLIKMERAKSLSGVDFTGAKNPPAGMAEGKSLSGAKLHGLDLTHIKAEKAKYLEGVDFTGSKNPPAGMAEGKNLVGAKLQSLDLSWIGINKAENYKNLNILGDVTIKKEIILDPEVVKTWNSNSEIQYRGETLDLEKFVALQSAFSKLIKDLPSPSLIPMLLSPIVESYLAKNDNKLSSLIELGRSSKEKENGFSLLNDDDFLKVLRSGTLGGNCQSQSQLFKDFYLDSSWDNVFQAKGMPNKQQFYMDLINICSSCLDASEDENEAVTNRNDEAGSPNSTSLVVDRQKPQEALETYLAHVAADTNNESSVRIVFKGEEGEDAGGLRREFFEILADHLRQNKIFTLNSESKLPYNLLGKMVARTAVIEKQITAFPIEADLEFYKKILRPQNENENENENPYGQFKALLKDKICSQDEAEQIHGRGILQSLKIPLKDYKEAMGFEEMETEEAVLGSLWMVDCSAVPSSRKRSLEEFAQGFLSVLSFDQLEKRKFRNAKWLKTFIEGEEEISLNELFSLVEFRHLSNVSPMNQKLMEEAYRNALREIIDEKPSEKEQQEIIRTFVRFATGSGQIKGNKIILNLNSAENFLPAAHTCSKIVDCPTTWDKEKIKKNLKISIEEGMGGFSFR